MQLRLLLIACLACSSFGCATATDTDTDKEQGAAAQPRPEGSYRTGSRLPSYDPPGTAASREMSADDWNDARRNGSNIGVYK